MNHYHRYGGRWREGDRGHTKQMKTYSILSIYMQIIWEQQEEQKKLLG